MVGQTISHYHITEKLGEGGMGVVYKAEDTKLERAVALKFLPPHLLGNEEVRKRFEREAKAAAALHHPNICPVYEIDEVGGKAFIAMAYIEGDSLDKKIAQSPLKLDHALDIAQQVAKGLEAAHKKGIFHRDIKPENLIVDEGGHVTIMDFGLAQLAEASRLTRDDTTLGTVAYMSPEQTEGSGTDHRTDIWSLGVVLYEMITGQQPFKGDYDKAVMYSILNEQPEPLTALRTALPMELERVTNKCIAKRQEERYQAAVDLIVDLQAVAKSSTGATRVVRAATGPSGKRTLLWPVLAAVATLLAVGVSWTHLTQPEQERPIRKFTLTPEGFQSAEARAAISPNGEYVVYSAGTPEMSLWVRPLNRESPLRLEGTEGAVRPFWSPDSEFIAFVAGSILKRLSVLGGPTVDVCRLPGGGRFFLGAWRPDGESIVFASRSPTCLYEVSAHGGKPQVLVDQAVRGTAVWASSPQFLSNRILLYRVGSPFLGESLVARDMETGEEQNWPVPAGAFAYSPTGYILYQPHSRFTGDLWALPFSSEPLGPAGDSFPIANNAGWPSVADDAVLVYRQEGAPQTMRVRIVDRSGAEIDDTDRRWRLSTHPMFSPDGKRLIVAASNADARDIWLYDLINRNWTRLAGDPGIEVFPVWAPDGERVSFSSDRGTSVGIYLQSAEPGDVQILLDTPSAELVTDWNRATDRILYYRVEADERSRDLWYLEPDGRGGYGPKLFLSEPFNQTSGAFSPDGRWVAYVTDQEGSNEVYVRKFPEGTPVRKVSREGGGGPRWRSDGKELYYVQAQTLMAVELKLDDEGFSFGAPQPLFSDPSFLDDPVFRRYDVAPDGRSFAVISYSPEALASPPVIRIVENWFEEFRGREQN